MGVLHARVNPGLRRVAAGRRRPNRRCRPASQPRLEPDRGLVHRVEAAPRETRRHRTDRPWPSSGRIPVGGTGAHPTHPVELGCRRSQGRRRRAQLLQRLTPPFDARYLAEEASLRRGSP